MSHAFTHCTTITASGDTYELSQCTLCGVARLSLLYATLERQLATAHDYDHGREVPLSESCLPPMRSQLPTLSEIQTADTERPIT